MPLARLQESLAFRLFVTLLYVSFGGSTHAYPQQLPDAIRQPVVQKDRVVEKIDISARTTLRGHVPGWASSETTSPVASGAAQSLQITLLLRRSPTAQKAFEELLAAQQQPGSPVYHRAVSPEQQGLLFGPTKHDVAAVTAWAKSQGLAVRAVDPTRMTVQLQAPAQAIENSFGVHLSMYRTGHELLRASDTEPSVPTALAPVIEAIGGITQENARPMMTESAAPVGQISSSGIGPQFTGSQGGHYITPADFATIYDLNPIYAAGNTGATIGSTPQHIAILGNSDVNATDVQAFAAGIGSSSYQFNVVLADGNSPGFTAGQGEGELDLERVLGTAPGVVADLVEGAGNTPLYDAASYAVYTLQPAIITISFGQCEPQLGSANSKFWQNVWSAAAANMTSVFVSGGDSGAAACDDHGSPAPAGQSLAINGFCSTAFNTCVGGTEFNDANATQYWSTTNTPPVKKSALSYIPEGAWNDPAQINNGTTNYVVLAGGGGVSQFNPQPSWQAGNGVPQDGFRHIPDISFSASATHDPYYFCGPKSNCTVAGQSNPSTFVAYGNGGTSATAPTMAAISALLNTSAGARQGNLNPMIYRLANSSVASQVFHDVTLASSGVANCDLGTPSMCNNSTPGTNSLSGGQAGYLVANGYDQATGWGSLDVANFIKAAVPVSTSLSLTASGTTVSTSQTITATAMLSTSSNSLSTASGTVQFFVNGTASGSPVALSNGAATSASISFPAAGTYALTAIYSGDALYVSSSSAAVSVSVATGTPGFTLASGTGALTFTSGATTFNSQLVVLTSSNNYAGSVNLSCVISGSTAAFPPSCSLPANATITSNGMTNIVVTINSTVAQARLEERTGANSHIELAGIPLSGGARLYKLGFALGCCGLPLVFALAKRKRLSAAALAVLCVSLLTLGVSGCSGGSSSSTVAPQRSSAGSYTVTVTGTGMGIGALASATASTSFSVVIR